MRFTLSFLACCLLALPAQAVNLPPMPQGSCALDSNQDIDRTATYAMHLSVQTPGSLKALFADCGELERLRQGRTQSLTSYSAVFEQKAALPEGTDRARAIQLIAEGTGLSASIASQSVNAAREPKNRESYHGILKQSDRVIIFGSEQRHLNGRQVYSTAAVSALTIVDGKFITMNFFAPLTDAESFARLGLAAESYANSLLAANP